MAILKEDFGSFQDQQVEQYSLSNDKGMTVKVMNYGATITSITITNETGQETQLACGFDTFDEYHSAAYKGNAPYFGCTVGRYASRIKDGRFSIDGVDYKVACNDGSNHLHGGIRAFDKRLWKATIEESDEQEVLSMTLASPHMEEGYPGNVNTTVRFHLIDDELHISYNATTDLATPLSLTNHTYFNLSGFKHTIENHKAVIASSHFLTPDETNVPIGGVTSVEGDITDLRKGRTLRDCFVKLPTGFEHYYALDNPNQQLQLAASFTDLTSKTTLEVLSTEPGALFYTGYFTSDDLQRSNTEQYGRFKGLCFETGRYPNGPNIDGSPGSITYPETPYTSKTVYKITTFPISNTI